MVLETLCYSPPTQTVAIIFFPGSATIVVFEELYWPGEILLCWRGFDIVWAPNIVRVSIDGIA